MCQEGAEDSLQGTPLPDTPLSMHAPTWEDLHITQTRAMLELRVRSSFTLKTALPLPEQTFQPVQACWHASGLQIKSGRVLSWLTP